MNTGIESFLKRIEDAYRRRDADRLAGLYHPRAKHPMPGEGVAVGHKEIRARLPIIFDMVPEDIESETIEQQIDLVTPEVAIIDSRVQNYRRTANGREPVSIEGFTMVAIHEEGHWLIAAIRGTLVPKA